MFKPMVEGLEVRNVLTMIMSLPDPPENPPTTIGQQGLSSEAYAALANWQDSLNVSGVVLSGEANNPLPSLNAVLGAFNNALGAGDSFYLTAGSPLAPTPPDTTIPPPPATVELAQVRKVEIFGRLGEIKDRLIFITTKIADPNINPVAAGIKALYYMGEVQNLKQEVTNLGTELETIKMTYPGLFKPE